MENQLHVLRCEVILPRSAACVVVICCSTIFFGVSIFELQISSVQIIIAAVIRIYVFILISIVARCVHTIVVLTGLSQLLKDLCESGYLNRLDLLAHHLLFT